MPDKMEVESGLEPETAAIPGQVGRVGRDMIALQVQCSLAISFKRLVDMLEPFAAAAAAEMQRELEAKRKSK